MKKPRSSPLSAAPAQRTPRKPPKGRVPSLPENDPVLNAPLIRATRAPKQRVVATVPNPRRPHLTRTADNRPLGDLFAFFPDLPRPTRPSVRVRKRGRTVHQHRAR